MNVVELFESVGGVDWYDKMVIGGASVIAFLVFAVVLILAHELLRRP